jgi:aspartyl-tRNA(Asn)/glutamyl-tRNA(Gln) amidotransferase subunit A
MRPAPTIEECLRRLAGGDTTCRELVEESFARIEDPSGEGERCFLRRFGPEARAAAAAIDRSRRVGRPPAPLSGVPVSVKDLFDVAGTTTRAGSLVLADRAPAAADAVAVARLRAAGAVIVGATNMAEFAMGVLGLNPHYGTPRNPWDRRAERIPGGSSSGAAVSVADGMTPAAIGTDTMGSVRIPAALCGVVGFKPTARRVPLRGAFPLSPSLDSIGVLASTVSCCARVDAVLAGTGPAALEERPPAALRLGLPRSVVLDDLDDPVSAAFARALSRLARAGCRIEEIELAELRELPQVSSRCSFHIAEGYARHRDLLARRGAQYDPLIARRLASGASITPEDYADLVSARRDLIRRADLATRSVDAVVMPATPTVAPRIAEIDGDAAFQATSFLVARNCAIANLLDRCAITLPCHRPGEPPVGLMLMGQTMADGGLLAAARRVESALEAIRRD